jgi:sigma-B regulation protein RsbU (phosphoserine phosphatase)
MAIPHTAASAVGKVMRTLLGLDRSCGNGGGMALPEQERIRRELEMCRQIQHQLLPASGRFFPFAEIEGISKPAREVGGDFFNYFALPGGDLAVVMGDVSGKGVPAALIMANLQATLRARLPHERDLGELARSLDLEIESTMQSESYVTLFLGILDHECYMLHYVNAGHNAQYVVRGSGRLERLESGGRPVGLLSGGDYTEDSVQLSPGDSLFLYTDGLVEVENERGESFGEERLEQLLVEGRVDDPDQVLARIERESGEHQGRTLAADDVTMLVLRVGARTAGLPRAPGTG